MQTNTERFFEEGNGIKVNPILETLRTTRFMLFIAIILFIILFIIFSLVSIWAPHSSGHPMVALYAFMMVINVFNLAMDIAQGRYWKRIEQRRFAIIQGDQTALAAEQPGPNVASMQLPVTIKMGYTKEFGFLLTGIILLVALYIAGTFSWIGPWFFTSNALLYFLI